MVNDPPSKLSTALNAALVAIPVVGSSLQIIIEDSQSRHQARLAQFATQVLNGVGGDRLAQRLRDSDAIDALFWAGLDLAGQTGLAQKRRLLAAVVTQAVIDDARIEYGQLVVQALRDLDAPQIRALERIRAAQDAATGLQVVGESEDDRNKRVHESVVDSGRDEPTPVVAALVRCGAVVTATLFGGGLAVYEVSDFGRLILADLTSEGGDP